MRSACFAALAALWVYDVAAHATFQDLWVNGVDMISHSLTSPLRARESNIMSYTGRNVHASR
jgi:hypothetical protein